MKRFIAWVAASGAAVWGAPSADACSIGGCPGWPSSCYNLKSTKWCASGGVSKVTLQNLGSYESAFDWARAEASDPHNGVANSLRLEQVSSGGQIKVYDYSGTADWWGLADQYTTTNGTCMKSARIQINKKYMTSTVRKQYTLLHEIGHAVGLNHVCVCPRTMNPCGTCGADAAGATPWLGSCDAKGLAAKYPGDDASSTPITDPIAEEALYQAHLADDHAHSDVDGDGRADICVRGAAGVKCYRGSASGFSDPIDGPALSDASGWGDSDNATTLRLLDMNGDGRADLCARANAGIRCWISTGSGFSSTIDGPELSDAASWDQPMYFSTLRAADFDGDGLDDLCVRSSTSFRCHRSTGSGFGPAVNGPALSNANGWNTLDRYSTIRMGDVNGDGRADVCARDASGMKCWLSTGSGFGSAISGPGWSNASGWNQPMYYATIRLADVDGDGKADLCARGSASYRCHLSTGSGFGDAIIGPTWSTASGWGDDDNYSTLRLADIDGDGDLDLCGRANAGMRCSLFSSAGFGAVFAGPELSDAKGWAEPHRFRTLRFADISGDGRADLCARGSSGVSCYLATAGGFATSAIAGPSWSDASGYQDPKYYATIRLAGIAPGAAGSAGVPGLAGSGGQAGAAGSAGAAWGSGGQAGAEIRQADDEDAGSGWGGNDPGAWDAAAPASGSGDPHAPVADDGGCRIALGASRAGRFWLLPWLVALAALVRRRSAR